MGEHGWVERDGEVGLYRDGALVFACRFRGVAARVAEDALLNRDNLHFLGEWSWEGFDDGIRRVLEGRRPVGTSTCREPERIVAQAEAAGCVTRVEGSAVTVARPEPFAELLDIGALCADWRDYFADCLDVIDPGADELEARLRASGPRDYLATELITAWDNATIAAVGVALGYPGWFISAGVREGFVEVPGGVEYGV